MSTDIYSFLFNQIAIKLPYVLAVLRQNFTFGKQNKEVLVNVYRCFETTIKYNLSALLA